jgi:hypothetical protein
MRKTSLFEYDVPTTENAQSGSKHTISKPDKPILEAHQT